MNKTFNIDILYKSLITCNSCKCTIRNYYYKKHLLTKKHKTRLMLNGIIEEKNPTTQISFNKHFVQF